MADAAAPAPELKEYPEFPGQKLSKRYVCLRYLITNNQQYSRALSLPLLPHKHHHKHCRYGRYSEYKKMLKRQKAEEEKAAKAAARVRFVVSFG